jgi:hypothetical protein
MAPTITRDAELDAVQDAPARVQVRNYFGQMTLDWDNYVLHKGEKRRLWSEQTDNEDDKRLIITFKLYPLPGAPSSNPIKREVIAQSREFDKYLRPSLAKLGVRLSNLKDAYCQIGLVPDGGTYTKKVTDQATGAVTTEEADSTALTFVAIYPTVDAAQEASAKLFKRDGATAVTPASPPPAPTAVSDDAAQQALEALWKVSGEKPDAFMATLGSLAPFKHLTLDSPEVKRITGTF